MSGLQQGELGSNPPAPGSGENGGRRDGLSPELIDHRLNELEGKTKEIAQGVQEINTTMGEVRVNIAKIETNMKHTATKAWILGGVLGGAALAATLAATIAGIILKYWPE